MRTRNLCLTLLLLIGAGDLLANERREHYVVAHHNRKPAYEVTRIHSENSSLTRRTFLIADDRGPLLQIELTNDYAGRQTVTSYQLVRGSRSNAKIVLDLPVASATRETRREELRNHPELDTKPVPVTIYGSGTKAHGIDSDWRKQDTAEFNRGRAKDILGKELVTVLGDLRELAGLPMFADFNAAFGYIFDDASLVQKSRKLMVAKTNPDCAFDAKFSVPCVQ